LAHSADVLSHVQQYISWTCLSLVVHGDTWRYLCCTGVAFVFDGWEREESRVNDGGKQL